MTSKSSSLANPVTIQKQLCMRRLWLVALLSVYSFLAGPVLCAIIIAAARASMGYMDPTEIFANGVPTVRYYAILQRGIRVVYGIMSPVFVGTLVWAFIIGLAVFAYLNDSKKMDFYESQPMKRDKRFLHMYFNGLILFGITTFAGMLLTQLTVLLFGAMTPDLFLEILISWARQIIFFLSCYGIVTLGAMVSGNLVIGFFAALFLYLLEPAAYLVRVIYRSYFLATYLPGEDSFLGITSPVYQYARGWGDMERFVEPTNSAPFLWQRLFAVLPNDGRILLIAVAGFVLTYAAYRHRKTEDAGSSIIFSFARLVIKVAVAVIAALLAGMAVYVIIGSTYTMSAIVTWIFIIILTAVLVCLFLESVFQMNVKAMFKHVWQVVLAVVIALVIYGYYDTGALGYDTYVPEVAQVESGAIVRNTYRSIQVGSERVNMLEYSKEHMIIEDAEALCEVLRAGEERMLALRDSGFEGVDFTQEENAYANLWESSVEATIVLRLKNGREMVRSIRIPHDINAQYMDRIIGTDAYKQVAFRTAYLEPKELIAEAGKDSEIRLVFEGMLQRHILHPSKMETVLEAYRKDLDAYDYTMIRDEMPLGNINLQFVYSMRDNTTFPVYSSFTNTLAVLKKEGIALDVKEVAKNINAITIHQEYWYDVYEGQPLPEFLSKYSYAITEPGRIVLDKTYTNPEQIEELIESIVLFSAVEDGVWVNRDALFLNYNLEVSVDGKTDEYDTTAGYYTFVKDKTPDFIANDFIM
ncbi:MAG: hypothetical protein IJR58_05805 [Lachnospiraceae bacterium]|nr:hypothetical protein [Lachnospiraceae bacterium]